MRAALPLFLLLLALPVLAAAPLRAAGEAAAGSDNPAQKYFTDVVLIDQDGEPRRLYSDLLAGKVVVINAFFTRCTGTCPILSRNLGEIQKWLGDRLGREVHLLSISVDPGHDTPEKVAEYARRFEARPGWYFLTGEPDEVRFALGKLGQYVEQKEAHTNLIIIGNEPTGLWKKAFGMAPARELIPIVRSVLEDPGEAGAGP